MAKKNKLKKFKVTIAWTVFAFVLGGVLLAESFLEIKGLFGIDGRMFFHAWYGFMTCIIIILFSRILAFFLKRQEGYYKENKNG